MLTFQRCSLRGNDQIDVEPTALIVAGWTGRDEAALRQHIEELAAIGVPRPSKVPVFYRNSSSNLSQAGAIEVLGPDTSGEVEPVVLALSDGLWLGMGSDHTDRKAEMMGIALSKQLCAKLIGRSLWPLAEIADHWDQLVLRSFATIGGQREKYQEGRLSALRPPADLIERYGSQLATNTVLYCGTFAAIGGIRPASRFEMEMEDPVLDRTMRWAYDIRVIPIIS